MNRIMRGLAIIGILGLVFCAGGYVGQATFEPKVITKVITIERVLTVYEPVEKIIIKEVPVKLRNFESPKELREWLDETGIRIQLIEGDEGIDCENFALGLQLKALGDGYLMSFEVIRANEYNRFFKDIGLSPNEIHAINLVIIGNGFYYIEPQTLEFALGGYLN